MSNSNHIIVVSILFLLFGCNENKRSDLNTMSTDKSNDSLKQVISTLEAENKSILFNNSNLKSELSVYEAQNDYIKKITVEYNSIQNVLSDVLQKQIIIINNTNSVEANRTQSNLSTPAKLRQYINFMENSYKNNSRLLKKIEQQLDTERNKIDSLNADLKNKGIIISELEVMISNLNEEIKKRDELVSSLQAKINNLNNEVISLTSELNTKLAAKDEEISNLNSELTEKNNKIQELTLESYHPYGKGYSKILIYTKCKDGGTTKIWIDGILRGSLNKYFNERAPNCDFSKEGAVVIAIVLSGSHHIKAEDDARRIWDFYLNVNEDECTSQGLICN